jgi:hypothetical protein
MQGSFSKESLDTYSALVSQSPGINYSESQKDSYDFTRCVRNDGSAYGTGGTCRKGTEATSLDVLQSGIKGRVPKDDPKEPLASGSTPWEKAKEKLKAFEAKISDPNRNPSERELEQYGKLKMAVAEFENKTDGRKKGLFGWTDNSDLDESKTREIGKERRKVLPNVEDRNTVVKAWGLNLRYLRGEDPILRRRSKATTEEILKLESDHKEVKETRESLEKLTKKLPKGTSYVLRSRMGSLLKTLKQSEASYAKAVTRLTTAKPKAPKPEAPKGEPKYHRDGSVTYHV